MAIGVLDNEDEKDKKPIHKHAIINTAEEREILYTKS